MGFNSGFKGLRTSQIQGIPETKRPFGIPRSKFEDGNIKMDL